FFKPRYAQFTHDEHIERCAQALCHFISNWNAAARQAEHNDVVEAGIFLELLRQLPASFCSIWKTSLHAADRAALRDRSERGNQRLHVLRQAMHHLLQVATTYVIGDDNQNGLDGLLGINDATC